jgi:branched-subunit amino acid transport protein
VSDTAIWIIIIFGGLGTLLLRMSFIVLEDRLVIPELFRNGLRFVPVAALTALVIPALLLQQGQINISLANERLLAGVVATLVAYFSRNVLLTISTGMVTLWALQAFIN